MYINKLIMNTDVECTSHWKKIGKNSWRGFVHLNTEEKKTREKQLYSWYHPYYWLY